MAARGSLSGSLFPLLCFLNSATTEKHLGPWRRQASSTALAVIFCQLLTGGGPQKRTLTLGPGKPWPKGLAVIFCVSFHRGTQRQESTLGREGGKPPSRPWR